MNWKKQVKAANSKGALVKHIEALQRAMAYYADENNWAVRDLAEDKHGGDIIWLGISDPTYVANRLLGRVKLNKELEVELAQAAMKVSKLVSGSRTESKEDGPKD